MTPSRLLWAHFPLSRCPECQGPLRRLEVNLALQFEEDIVSFDVAVAYCADSDTVFADLALIEEALDEAGFALGEAEAFSINDAPVEAGIWLGERVGAAPWDLHRQAMTTARAWHEREAPAPEEVRQLPQGEESWFFAQAPGSFHLDDEGEATLNHIALVVSESELVLGASVHEEALHPKDVLELVLTACARPPQGVSPERPARVVLEDEKLAQALNQELARLELGFTASAGDVEPALEALRELKASLAPEPVPTYFIHYPEADVKAFFKAAKHFFRARPWEILDGYKFLGFRLGDGPWHYASVMGQGGEEFGIAFFKDWLELCKAVNNEDSMWEMMEAMMGGNEPLPKPLRATGGAESMSLSPLEALAPEDAALLQRLKIKPSWRKDYAAVHRYTPYGMETPRLELSLYTGLMTVLAERAEKASGRQVTSLKASSSTPKGELQVQYPARGDEDAPKDSYFSFRVPFSLGVRGERPGEFVWAEVRAPGEAKWHRVMTALTREAKKVPDVFPWVHSVRQGEFAFWVDRAPVKEPSPTVAQLAAQPELTLQLSIDEQSELAFTALPRPDKAEISVTFEQ